ncbi:ATP-grasp domain-containing protein [Nicoliella spurrieriana]|uniref:ATP-grasp domain-containing protein n=1 Tax=Nicoliella spurrieriana TaxID=2925830 RepID=A0A976RRM4_9LACO|nr:ATP-grasp domain-containing protein [Nicoliella spurrieriana]UQS86598.1 ATP-grasp domain-containing protein [Nicoliella spurrieriana]
MIDQSINKVLIIGGGPSKVGQENELDAAIFQTVVSFKRVGVKSIIIDDNPYSIATTEIKPASAFIEAVNLDNLVKIIQCEHPDAILPTLGGPNAIALCQKLDEMKILAKESIQLLGLSKAALKLVGNPLRFSQLMKEVQEPIISSTIVHSNTEAFDLVRKVGFPIIIKPVLSSINSRRTICNSFDELDSALTESFTDSTLNRCVIEKSIVGYKELSVLGIRDPNGTKLIINGIEDIDAIGIHSGDSIAISPIQTITDFVYQRLREAALKVIDQLAIVGACEVSFAVNPDTNDYFVTKVTPNYNRGFALATLATGYPLNYVAAQLVLGNGFADIHLPHDYAKLTTFMEPVMDRILIRIPLWPFDSLKHVDQHLDQSMKSVGSAVGIGRTVEEALLKAMRSSQFNPRDVLPNMEELSDDELISQLIHPKASRILVLIEALRRNYPVEDLSELTKIDPFYFKRLKKLLTVENLLLDRPLTADALITAHRSGFGDGMLAAAWQVDLDKVRAFSQSEHSLPTYKMIEPSAGEESPTIRSFYSSFELENESHQLSDRSALVIGRGGNRLGPNTAADYYTSEVLIQMHRLGYKTIIMNNNPNSVSLSPQLSDKQYIEPIQIGAILNIAEIEKPAIVVVPGNRHYLVRQLRQYPELKVVVLPPDQETGVTLPQKTSFAMNFFVTKDEIRFINTVKLASGKNNELKDISHLAFPYDIDEQQLKGLITDAKELISSSYWKGLVQILVLADHDHFKVVGIRPIRIIETIFLNRISNVNWIKMLVKLYTNHLSADDLDRAFNELSFVPSAEMKPTFPFIDLKVDQIVGTTNQEVGAQINFDPEK